MATQSERRPEVSGYQRIVAKAAASERSLFAAIAGLPSQRPFAVRWWDGVDEQPVRPPTFTLRFTRPGALRSILLPPSELGMAEAYLRGDLEVDGSLEAAAGYADSLAAGLVAPHRLPGLLFRALQLPNEGPSSAMLRAAALIGTAHTPERDLHAVRFHYDMSNDFYRLWLDRRMVYSCAYFETGSETLDQAQEAKLDLICRKLRLRPGHRLLDIGCGWGGLIIHAARHYGVHAIGITLSEQQAALARERIAAEELDDVCRVEVADYRSLAQGETFDRIASVGMVEHVGRANLDGYFAEAYRLLRPGGLFLNHGIVFPQPLASGWRAGAAGLVWRPGSFIRRYVFPDGELVTPGELVTRAETAGFETRDLESLREHYVLTLRHWVRRLEAHAPQAVATVGEGAYRTWRLYMAGFAYAFATGGMGVVQHLLSKPDHGATELPLTRRDLYRTT